MRDEAEDYAARLEEDGVQTIISRYPKMIHGFFLMAGSLDAGKKCIDEVGATLRNVFQSK
jgi:acetyl esterase